MSSKLMKVIMKTGPKPGAELREVPVPKAGPGEVLVRVKRTSICGTDNHIYSWDPWAASRIKTPLVFGHEFAGVIEEVGSGVTTHKVGNSVSAETHIVCNKCYQCRTGQMHVCKNVKILGVDIPGCFAEYVVVPAENAWLNDPSLPFEIASVQEPFGNAVHTVFAGHGVTGRSVAVIGCGAIGIMAAGLARAMGATAVYAVDVNPYRLELVKRYNPTRVINAASEDPVKVIQQETNGEGIDVLLEMSGNEKAIAQGFTMLKEGGHASLLGLTPRPITMDINNAIVFKGATVYGISGRRMYRTWYQTKAILGSKAVDLSKVITHRFHLHEFAKGFELMAKGECGKVVLEVE